MDFTKASDATARHQEWRNNPMCGSENGTVWPVEIVDVTAVFPPGQAGRWIESGRPILLVYGADRHYKRWFVSLRQGMGHEGHVSLGVIALDEQPDEREEFGLRQACGISPAEFQKLYLACVPDQIKRAVRDTGIAI